SRSQRHGVVAVSPHSYGRSKPAAFGDGLYRSVSVAQFRRPHACGGSAGYAGHAGEGRKDPLYRLLQLLRLASQEVAGRLGQVWMGPLCGPSGVLLPDRARLRMGADAPGTGPEGWSRRLEPLRMGTADRQDTARSTAALDQPPPEPHGGGERPA